VTRYWLGLTRLRGVPGGGAPREKGLFGETGLKVRAAKVPRAALREAALRHGAKALFEASTGGMAPELPPALRRCLAGFDDWDWVDAEMERAAEAGVVVLPMGNEAYPALLHEIPDPPLVLYAKGDISLAASDMTLAVVGTRRPTHYGLRMAERISADMAGLGAVIVSGMARGCDMAAHNGALVAGGGTIAVLGTGVDRCYPAEARRLYDEVADKGLLLSEFPLGAGPMPHNFPRRNRIISGLSRGVLVAEAPLRSGAMMTARLALEQNRDVFALPGPVTSYKSQGPNSLIKAGAVLVEHAGDIFSAWGLGAGQREEPCHGETSRAGAEEACVLKTLLGGPLSIDEISARTGIETKDLGGLLLEMELKGLVDQRPGKIFCRKV